jgi:phosphoserine phosphatase
MSSTSDKKQELEQLRNAEKKFQSFIEKRNELNDYAKILREERDMLNAQHRDIKDEIKTLKKERDVLVDKMKHHKSLRNKLQSQAKELISARRKKKGEVFKNLPLRLEEIKADVQMLEYRQETVPMSTAEENDLIDTIREKQKEFKAVKIQSEHQETIMVDISDKDKAIDELFKKADEQHELVQNFYDESQDKHKQYMKLVDEVAIAIAEANKKHEQYIETRNEAQKNHEKAMEMRDHIVQVRGDRRRRFEEAKKLIKDQNIKARKAVLDKDKLNEIADDSISALKNGKKISL